MTARAHDRQDRLSVKPIEVETVVIGEDGRSRREQRTPYSRPLNQLAPVVDVQRHLRGQVTSGRHRGGDD
jgi:hypothetical protein